jgi:hypothetical protein
VRRSGRALVALAVTALLAVLVPSAAADPPPLEHDPQQVRELADDVLERDEFQPPERSLLERFVDWLQDLLDDGDGRSDGTEGRPGTGGSSPVGVVLLVLAVVAVGSLAHHLLRRPRRRRDDDADPEIELESPRAPRQWLADAERAEAEGRWKDGLRCRFRALVEQLVEEGVVPEVAGRTSGELRADVRAVAPPAAAAFAEAAELFDRAWYGDLPTGPEEVRRFAVAAARTLAGVARRPAGVGS